MSSEERLRENPTATPSPLDFPACLPELHAISDLLLNPHNKPLHEEEASFTNQETAGTNAQRRIVETAGHDVIDVVAAVVAGRAPAGDEATHVEKLFETAGLATADGTVNLAQMKAVATSKADYTKRLYDVSDGLMTAVENEVKDDPAGQYKILRILAQSDRSERGVEHDAAAGNLQAMAVCSHVRHGQRGLVASLQASLNRGEYDTFVAEDILHGVLRGTRAIDGNGRKDDLRNLVGLIMLGADMDSDRAVDFLSSPNARGLWPEHLRDKLAAGRKAINDDLARNIRIQRDEYEEEGYLLKVPADDIFHRTARNLLDAVDDYRTGVARGGMSRREEVIDAVESKKRRSRTQAGPIGQTAVPAAAEIEERPARRLYFIDEQNEEVAEGSPEYQDAIDTYLNGHLGDPNLAEDVKNVLNYLRSLDFSKGSIRGVKKYSYGLRKGEKLENLYALKPSDAVGLPTASPFAKKLRVIFTVTPDSIGVVHLMDKHKIAGFENRNGLGRAHSRGNK